MIEIKDMDKRSFRTFGWVQDPSDFNALYRVVSIFNESSQIHKELVENKITKLIEERDGRDRLLIALNSRPLKLKYGDLVGTAFSPRSSARCNGIVQATVEGQQRPFISDWPADNFIRWAQCLGFIKYNYYDDTFEITEIGLEFSNIEEEEKRSEILEEALLSYSPAVRILSLLEDGTPKTKFELGQNLGFVGEDGFTSLPQDILVMTLANEENIQEKNKLRTDTEGSSDKYARMIAKWLIKLDLLKQITKTVTVQVGNFIYTENIGQSYVITAKGIKALNKAIGKSKFKRIPKNISWEMLATKGVDRDYIRTRRAYIIKILLENKNGITLEEIRDKLELLYMTSELFTVVKDDIEGLINIGLNITIKNSKYYFDDAINDFIIPRVKDNKNEKSEITIKKDELREQLDTLSHEYLSLVDLSFDSKQNKLFEMKVVELLTKECKYKGLHLGGSRKPDGIIYTSDLSVNYGVIIDTKAYSKGYDLPISQVDEMARYIEENNRRDKTINPNEWWNNFNKDVDEFYFTFISGEFKGNIEEKLERITIRTHRSGAAIAIMSLIKLANEIKAQRMDLKDVKDIFVNKVY